MVARRRAAQNKPSAAHRLVSFPHVFLSLFLSLFFAPSLLSRSFIRIDLAMSLLVLHENDLGLVRSRLYAPDFYITIIMI